MSINLDYAEISVVRCDIENLSFYTRPGSDANNIDVNPLFANPPADNFQLQYASPVLNKGGGGAVPDDFDIDDDSNTSEPTPDRRMGTRQVNPSSCVDIGAYENQIQGTCPQDISGSNGVPDGFVNVADLIVVLNRWLTPGGAADFSPSSCGDGVVDTAELLVILNNWGSCLFTYSGPPETIDDCYDDCYALWPEDEEQFGACMTDCVHYLCSQELINCD